MSDATCQKNSCARIPNERDDVYHFNKMFNILVNLTYPTCIIFVSFSSFVEKTYPTGLLFSYLFSLCQKLIPQVVIFVSFSSFVENTVRGFKKKTCLCLP